MDTNVGHVRLAQLVRLLLALLLTTASTVRGQGGVAEVVQAYPPLFTDPDLEPVYSRLWGQDGERWDAEAAVSDPENSALRDFTDVGYRGGNEPIPDYPVWKSLPELGGVPDDGVSDVAALRRAISECPPNHAIFLPHGRYIIDEQIKLNSTQNNIVIRGESRDGTVLFFPKHTREILGKPKSAAPMIIFEGGEERGIENLSLVFRDEQKATGYFREPGATNSGRNIGSTWGNGPCTSKLMVNKAKRIRGHGICTSKTPITPSCWWTVGRVTFPSSTLLLTSLFGAAAKSKIPWDTTASNCEMESSTVWYVSTKELESNAESSRLTCLLPDLLQVHNILVTGNFVHDIGLLTVQHNAFSRIKGLEVLKLDHHALGNQYNLFTEVDQGEGGQGWGEDPNNYRETYWGITGTKTDAYLPSSRECTFVGTHTYEANSIGSNWHHETLYPLALSPANIYLAQMAKNQNKYLSPYQKLTLPPPAYDRVFQLLPSDDGGTLRWEGGEENQWWWWMSIGIVVEEVSGNGRQRRANISHVCPESARAGRRAVSGRRVATRVLLPGGTGSRRGSHPATETRGILHRGRSLRRNQSQQFALFREITRVDRSPHRGQSTRVSGTARGRSQGLDDTRLSQHHTARATGSGLFGTRHGGWIDGGRWRRRGRLGGRRRRTVCTETISIRSENHSLRVPGQGQLFSPECHVGGHWRITRRHV